MCIKKKKKKKVNVQKFPQIIRKCNTSGPKHWGVCLYHWRPGWSRYEETTGPIKSISIIIIICLQSLRIVCCYTVAESCVIFLSVTWKISSLCDSKEWSFNFRLRRSHNATVYSQKQTVSMLLFFSPSESFIK